MIVQNGLTDVSAGVFPVGDLHFNYPPSIMKPGRNWFGLRRQGSNGRYEDMDAGEMIPEPQKGGESTGGRLFIRCSGCHGL